MVSRIREFPVAREFPEPREIPVTREFPRPKLFPPASRETGISREFPARGFPLNITAKGIDGHQEVSLSFLVFLWRFLVEFPSNLW